jgi:Arc/MetJ-type ribon-helix-helix transcriptional regulator
MKKTTVYLSDEQTRYIKDRAREVGSSEAEVIRSAIDRLAEAQPIARKRPRSIGAFSSDTIHGRDFEGWLAANWERDW